MFTKKQIEKAKECKSVDEILALAKENEVKITKAEAEKYFSSLNPESGELADEELDNVAGGCGGDGPACPNCGSKNTDHPTEWSQDSRGNSYWWLSSDYVCKKCAHRWNPNANNSLK